ncbi:hypothetical protein [Mesorhizobium marinum]|uniref:Uncharacterized protein n=1 Tax=Mesorhizobium marinum TaxID=3228790 RepID=A0ABV3QX01_9HYPH
MSKNPFGPELTDVQFALIGRIAVQWTRCENVLQEILASLAWAPRYFGRALTNSLGPDNRIGAIKSLCMIHEKQMLCQVVSLEQITKIRQIAVRFDALKGERNKFIHWSAIRKDDDNLFFSPLKSLPADPKGGDCMLASNAEMLAFSEAIATLTYEMMLVEKHLPNLDWPKPSP